MNPQDLSLSNVYSPANIVNFLLDVINNAHHQSDFVKDTFKNTSTNQLRDVLHGTVPPPMNYAMELKSTAVDYYVNRVDLLNEIIIPQTGAIFPQTGVLFLDFLKLMYSIGEFIEKNAQQPQQFNPALQPVVHIIDDESDEDDVQFMAAPPSPKKSKPIEIIDIDNWKGVESLNDMNCGICGKSLTNKEPKLRLIPCGHFIHDTPNDSDFMAAAPSPKKCPVCMKKVENFQNVGVNPDPKDYLGGKQKRKYKRKPTKKNKRKFTKIHKKKHHNRKTKYKKNKY